MLDQLRELIDQIDLNWCDNPGKDIHLSENYRQLMTLFPNLQKIHQMGLENDKFEFDRTIRHVFRTLKVYFSIQEHTFHHSSLEDATIEKIRKKFLRFAPKYIPLLLIYHDIGRFIDRKTHASQSSKLILEHRLLEDFQLSELEQLLLRKLIEYHLLIATTFTGESTFFGILSLLNDEAFVELISQENYPELFIDMLEAFTYLDVLGYPYAQVFDHYLNYYEEIGMKFKHLLTFNPDLVKATDQAKRYSLQWTDWRLAAALRIFQFIGTKPHLTKEFYFAALQTSIRPECETRGVTFNWIKLKDTFLANTYKFQIKYALAFLLVLAFGEFKRFRLKENQQLSSKLLLFWIALNNELKIRGLDMPEVVWNVYFENLPFWSELTTEFISKLHIESLKSVIHLAEIYFDDTKKEYNMILDFKNL